MVTRADDRAGLHDEHECMQHIGTWNQFSRAVEPEPIGWCVIKAEGWHNLELSSTFSKIDGVDALRIDNTPDGQH